MGVSLPPVENTAADIKDRDRGASFAVTCHAQTSHNRVFWRLQFGGRAHAEVLVGTELGLPRKAPAPPTSTRRKGQSQPCFLARALWHLKGSMGAQRQCGGRSQPQGPTDCGSLRHTTHRPRHEIFVSTLPSDFYVHPKKFYTENGRRGCFFRFCF